MSSSKLQKTVSQQLSLNFGIFTIRENIRPDWLLDGTGRRLEIDFYIEEIKIAIEVQGQQHYAFTKFFHGDYKNFADQVRRDNLKRDYFYFNGIKFYEISSESDLNDVIEDIKSIIFEKPDSYETDIIKRFARTKMDELFDLVNHISDKKSLRSFMDLRKRTYNTVMPHINHLPTDFVTWFVKSNKALQQKYSRRK